MTTHTNIVTRWWTDTPTHHSFAFTRGACVCASACVRSIEYVSIQSRVGVYILAYMSAIRDTWTLFFLYPDASLISPLISGLKIHATTRPKFILDCYLSRWNDGWSSFTIPLPPTSIRQTTPHMTISRHFAWENRSIIRFDKTYFYRTREKKE